MKRKIIAIIFLCAVVALSLFVYHRFKTKRIAHIIGANQLRMEEFLRYPNEYVILDEIEWTRVDERVKKIMKSNGLRTSKPILRYTISGSIRKQVFWLIDHGDGYYVVEAIDTNV